MQRNWFGGKMLQLVAFGLAAVTMSDVYANPIGGKVTTGSGTITKSGSVMTIYQRTDKLGINWDSFSIGANETVNFLQPGYSAVALNRVTGLEPSAIFGHLNANGQVFLVNSSGVLFAPGAKVSVGALTASSLSITDSDFQAGHYSFSGNTSGSVINQGIITAKNGGYVALLGPQAKNEGLIVAKQGTVVLGAGNAMTMDMKGDNLVKLVVNEGAIKALAENKNLIEADGGQVIMTARTADQLAGAAVNNSGIIRARGISNVGGSIILEGDKGETVNSGTLDASGKDKGQTGGTVKLLGDKVSLESGGKIDVSGDQGGGTALIGGNYQGQGPEANATETSVEKNAVIKADALTAGNGGQVVVWANNTTDFSGNISARGGIKGGNGGQAEVSGKEQLNYQGFTDLRASTGQTGNLLLDPADFTIDAGNKGTIETQLMGANLTILSSQGTTGTNGDIVVNSGLTWHSGSSLTLSAYHDVKVNAPITGGSGASVVLKADNEGHGLGTVSFSGAGHVSLNGGGKLSIYYNPLSYGTPTNYSSNVSGGSVTAYMLVNSLANLSSISNNSGWWGGNYALGCDIDAGGTLTDVLYNNGGLGFKPIGSSSTPFTGIFDGGGHTIDNLFINRTAEDNVGLFGYSQGTISNMKLINANITGQSNVGGLIGYNSGSMEKSFITGIVTGGNSTGGLVGGNHGIIDGAANMVNVTGTGWNTGGIAGYNDGSITNSVNSGAVSAYHGSSGGLVGLNDGLVTNSSSTGAISGVEIFVGGAVAFNRGKVENCYSLGDVSGSGNYVGGLVGANNGAIINSYSTGKVTGTDLVGGLVGYNNNSIGYSDNITASYSTGLVIGNNYVGGLAGQNDGGIIKSSYSTGNTTGNTITGGLAGYNSGTIISSYNNGAVTGSDNIGGLVGYNDTNSMITNSYNTANVNGHSSVGGIAGKNYQGTIKNSYNTGAITGNSTGTYDYYLGGIAGNNNGGRIEGSYNTGTVAGIGIDYVGGVAGQQNNNGIITTSYNMGRVTGEDYVGGIAGVIYNGSYISNSYNTGIIKGVNNVGGILGQWGWLCGTNSYCYNTGAVFGTSNVQGLGDAGFIDSYWDSETVGLTGSNGKTTSQMMNNGTFSTWDSSIWGIVPGTSYPYLKFQFSTPPQIISGKVDVSGAGKTIEAAVNGTHLGETLTGANGFYYFAVPSGSVPDSSVLLTYVAGDTVKSNAVYVSSGTHITNLNLDDGILSLGSGGALVTGAALKSGLSSISAGAGELLYSVSGNDITVNNHIKLYADAGLDTSGHITLGEVTANAHTLSVAANDITLNGNISSSAGGNAVVLSAGHSLFEGGTITNSSGGRWLVYTPNAASWTGADLASNYAFTQYGTLIGAAIQGSGNGLIYASQLTFNQSLVGSVSKTYDGTTSVNNLGAVNYQIASLPGFTAVIDSAPTVGTYADKNIGSGKLVTAAPAVFSVTDSNNKPVYGVTSTMASGNIGVILPGTAGSSPADNGPSINPKYPGSLINKSVDHNIGSQSNTLAVNVINRGVNMGSLQGLFTAYTDKGDAVTVVSVVSNKRSNRSTLQLNVKTVNETSDQMTINKDLPDALGVAFNGPAPSQGCTMVEYDGTQFLVGPAKAIDRKSAAEIVDENSFSLIYNNGQTDTYRVIRSGAKLTITPISKNSGNITREISDITKLVLAVSIKVAVDTMQADPAGIQEISWDI